MAYVGWDDKLQNKIFQWLEYNPKNKFIEIDGTGVALGSAIGLVRQENQDRVLFLRMSTLRRSFVVAVLCDGMGGMLRGEDSAKLALSVFISSLIRSQETTYPEILKAAIHQANEVVFNHFSGDGGTTLSAVICNDKHECWAINVGDSRIYQVCTDGNIKQLSIDDTLEAQLADLKKLGKSYPPEFRQLIQYIGMGQDLEPNQFQVELNSETNLIILTSDGIHEMPSNTFHQLIINSRDSAVVIERLITHSEWIGGRDNATAVAISMKAVLGISKVDRVSLGKIEIWGLRGSVEIWEPSTLNPINKVDTNTQTYKHQLPKKTQEKKSRKVIDKKSQDNQQKSNEKSIPQLKIDLSNEGL